MKRYLQLGHPKINKLKSLLFHTSFVFKYIFTQIINKILLYIFASLQEYMEHYVLTDVYNKHSF